MDRRRTSVETRGKSTVLSLRLKYLKYIMEIQFCLTISKREAYALLCDHIRDVSEEHPATIFSKYVIQFEELTVVIVKLLSSIFCSV
jgi:hypothetical protein